ncbi:hypothetical protein E2C01_076149 [Portunus trituberculatus]|uniref:Chitin-binding type-2 domain-containing protein n=1 Tax=Portunus trituberculatus TaxID=210409 RepID=A0A5B7ILA4_PORTR|nr:hypothetical protein [Portunus trituberculatus]
MGCKSVGCGLVVPLLEEAHFSFMCGNQTVFSQDTLTCTAPEEAYPCNQAESLYDLSNADFGRIPEIPEENNLDSEQ